MFDIPKPLELHNVHLRPTFADLFYNAILYCYEKSRSGGGYMESKTKVFCWHHSDASRLRHFLSQGIVDCPRNSFLTEHGLKPGDQIRFSVKVRNQGEGRILAAAELGSGAPHYLQHPRHKDFPWGVNLRKIVLLDGNQLCMQYPYPKPPPMNPSHWV